MALRNLATAVAFLAFFGECQLSYDAKEIEVDESRHDVEFFTFVTRPDIDAPTWSISVYDEDAVAPGLWFVAPYGIVAQTNNDSAYVAPHIYAADGSLIWSGIEVSKGYDVYAFQVSDVGGQPMLTTLHPYEERGVLINENYEIFAEVDVGEYDVTINMHEFQVVDDGKRAMYLTLEHETSLRNARRVGYQDGPCEIYWNGIEERDIETGEVTFTWSSKDHIALEESTMYEHDPVEICEALGRSADYLHLNALEKLSDGNYLTSGRRSDAIYKISHEDGSILWRLGGKKNDFELDGHFSGQHDVRCLSENSTHLTLSILDNAKGPGWPQTTNPNSRGLILSVNTQDMTAKAIKHYDHPYMTYANGRGNFQTLPNGNAFICWRDHALCSEHSPEGTLLKMAQLQSGLKTYRGYKSEWIGRPKSPPDVHSQLVELDEGLATAVHVSWNGDTEVVFWDLYAADSNGENMDYVLRAPRAGFETAMLSLGHKQHVVVQGLDRTGKILGKSEVFETIESKMTDSKLLKHLQWLQDPPELSSDPTLPIWRDKMRPLISNPVFTFFGGILVCVVAGLFTRGVRVGWQKYIRGRKEIQYAALADIEDDGVEDAFYDKNSQEIYDLGRDSEDIGRNERERQDND